MAKAYLSKVYAWMALSLLVTAGVAYYCSQDAACLMWVCEHMVLVALSTFVIVLAMFFCTRFLTSGALAVLLMAYAGATGLLFGPLALFYTKQSLAQAFICTAGTFGVMTVYGMYTKRDISPWGRALFMGLIGLIIAMIVSIFFGGSTMNMIINIAGVVIFTLFTAYDTQMILRQGLILRGDARAKGAVLGALELYLDFINLFLYLLRLLGDRK